MKCYPSFKKRCKLYNSISVLTLTGMWPFHVSVVSKYFWFNNVAFNFYYPLLLPGYTDHTDRVNFINIYFDCFFINITFFRQNINYLLKVLMMFSVSIGAVILETTMPGRRESCSWLSIMTRWFSFCGYNIILFLSRLPTFVSSLLMISCWSSFVLVTLPWTICWPYSDLDTFLCRCLLHVFCMILIQHFHAIDHESLSTVCANFYY